MTEGRTTTTTSPLSPNQINSMQRCPQAYLFRYGHGMIEPPKWAFTIGKAVEYGIQRDYAHAMGTGTHLPCAEVKEITREGLRASLQEEPPIDKEFNQDEAVDHVVETAGVFHDEVGIYVAPTALEVEVRYKLDEGLPEVRGFIDVVATDSLVRTEDGFTQVHEAQGAVLIDNKTSSAGGGWNQGDVAASLQPVAYTVGMEASGARPVGFQFHVARHASGGRWLKKKATQILDAVITEDMRKGWTKLVRHAARQREAILESGVAMPLYGWQCKGCGFRDACTKEWGREPPA